MGERGALHVEPADARALERDAQRVGRDEVELVDRAVGEHHVAQRRAPQVDEPELAADEPHPGPRRLVELGGPEARAPHLDLAPPAARPAHHRDVEAPQHDLRERHRPQVGLVGAHLVEPRGEHGRAVQVEPVETEVRDLEPLEVGLRLEVVGVAGLEVVQDDRVDRGWFGRRLLRRHAPERRPGRPRGEEPQGSGCRAS
ncbi:Uncharacterised protein [Mycobacteroides abscessus]|nr:Uncharacterised protein [Mycobacteroides abscessus]